MVFCSSFRLRDELTWKLFKVKGFSVQSNWEYQVPPYPMSGSYLRRNCIHLMSFTTDTWIISLLMQSINYCAFIQGLIRNTTATWHYTLVCRVALTKHYRLGGLHKRIFFSFGGWKSKIKIPAELVSPKACLLWFIDGHLLSGLFFFLPVLEQPYSLFLF